jgi:hypothetical protein
LKTGKTRRDRKRGVIISTKTNRRDHGTTRPKMEDRTPTRARSREREREKEREREQEGMEGGRERRERATTSLRGREGGGHSIVNGYIEEKLHS